MLSGYFISKYLNTLILTFILYWENISNLKCWVNFPLGMWPKLIGKGKLDDSFRKAFLRLFYKDATLDNS